MSTGISALCLCGILCAVFGHRLYGQVHPQLNWEELPAIDDRNGFAGMFAGTSHDALICVGGANFPEAMPWDGGKKVWYDHIYVLVKGSSSWRRAAEKLPRPLAYGVSCSYRDRVIIAGGNNAEGTYADVYSIRYENGSIHIETLPSLPVPLANMTGALVEDRLYIAGGQEHVNGMPLKRFMALDMRAPESNGWQELDPWPGPARIQAVSASLQGSFFLFSGLAMEEHANGSVKRNVLNDAFRYVPGNDGAEGSWKTIAPLPRGVAAGASPAPTLGSDHILFFGGLDEKTARHNDPATFPGFADDVMAYHVESDRWVAMGNLPDQAARVTVPAVRWNDKWVVVNGEVGPGKRSPKNFALSRSVGFGWLNWMALIAYLVMMLWIGYLFDKKDQTTNNFYTASGKIPWWAAGLSIYGTQLSAITFMAVPAIVYATDWSLAVGPVMILATVPFVVRYYIPFFRRLNVTSAYQYLEYRFNAATRVLGSISFILFQLGRIGIVLFLPAAAIASVTGVDIYLLIAIMGVICVIYTVMGGIEAVIWADVIQVFILIGGAVLCLVIAITHIDGGLTGVISKGVEAGKFNLVNWGWGLDKLYLWIGIVGFFFLNIIPYTSDQTIVQRYVTVKDEKAAAQSLYTNGLITLPGIIIFFGLGTVLYLFYRENPASIPSESVGEVLPYFVVHEIPAGIAGLIIAGVFAASQSTLSSSMNSVSAAYATDIHFRYFRVKGDAEKLKIAKNATIVAGFFGITSAMLTAALDVEFIFNLFQEVLGIFGGSLAGVFILGIFFRRANAQGALTGFFAGVIAVWLVKENTSVTIYLYGAISIVTAVVVGYATSLFFPMKKGIEGLSYATLEREDLKLEIKN